MNKMKSSRVLLLGCGDIGGGLGLALQASGRPALACRRDTARLPSGLQGCAVDHSDIASLERLRDHDYGAAVFTPTPATRDPEGYRRGFLLPAQNLVRLWQDEPARDVVFVSSTRVYGDCGGAWVDEETPPKPEDEQAEYILAAEQALLQSHHRVTVVRFSGIYGRQPSHLLRRLQQGIVSPARPPVYSNRIHREDCIASLLHLLDLDSRESLYLATDSEPVLQREFDEWVLAQLGVTAQAEKAAGTMSRRCSNRRLLASGMVLRFPDYRSGYSAMISSISTPTPRGSAAT